MLSYTLGYFATILTFSFETSLSAQILGQEGSSRSDRPLKFDYFPLPSSHTTLLIAQVFESR